MAEKRTRKRSSAAVRDAIASKRVTIRPYGAEEQETREQEVMVFESEPAYVRASAGVTKNLGDYESLRIDVSVSVPCYREDVEETYEAVADQVYGLLEAEIENYMPEK